MKIDIQTNTMKERLYSLDLLRGLDMLFLRVASPILIALGTACAWPEAVRRQFTHPWGGFTAYDIIMPMFIFMCGAAVPLALPRRMENGRAGRAYWRHVLWRVVMLWVLGMMCQGNLLDLVPANFALYTNTLQSIAAGYLIAAVVLLLPNRRVRFAAPFALAAAYGLLMALCGDYSREGNVAYVFETWLQKVLPVIGYTTAGHYTWFLTTLMFGAMTLFGLQATEILQNAAWSQRRRAGVLAGYGAGLLAAGWLLVACGVPMIKQIFTVSFSLQAVGWCMLLYAALYVVGDIWKVRRGTGLVTLYGQCALVAYMIPALFWAGLEQGSKTVLRGVIARFDARWTPVIAMVGYAVMLTVILYFYRRAKSAKGTK